jgi:HPt (histidine-containing phosphotransfer) domain-containing protein
MNIQWNTTVIDPKELIQIARGDKHIVFKYLQQFQQLIPKRIESLKESMEIENRKEVRQILHQMSPQLQFFGIPDVIQPIRRLEHEYKTIPLVELNVVVQTILNTLHMALKDVEVVLKENF